MLDGGSQRSMDRQGFRLRGREMTRTETFTDAAFAFAVTLLVISTQSVPTTFPELTQALKGVPAFAISFIIIMVFWHGHWSWSRRFGLEDLPTIILSGALVFVVLVYVYPLKYLYSLATWYFSRGRIFTDARIEEGQINQLFAIYSTGFVGLCLLIAGLNVYAYRKRDTLELDALEQHLTRFQVRAWLLVASIGTISGIIALVTDPLSPIIFPAWIYLAIPVVMPLYGARSNRVARRLYQARLHSSPDAVPATAVAPPS